MREFLIKFYDVFLNRRVVETKRKKNGIDSQ
jgi:hypothetical protein